MTTDLTDLFRRGVAEFDRRVQAITGDQWSNDTPCTEWNVRELVNHVAAEDLWTPPLLAGRTLEEVGDRFDGDVLGDDPAAVWAAARDDAVAVVADVDPVRRVHTTMGDIPASEYIAQLFADHVVHAWDLARGIGADATLDGELVAHTERMARPHEEMMRSSGVFGDRVQPPAETDPQTRLLALYGRQA